MKNLKREAAILKNVIVKKFGSIRFFAYIANLERGEVLKKLSIDLNKKDLSELKKLVESTEKTTFRKNKITQRLIDVLQEKILNHEDSKNKKGRVSFREFFSKNYTWTNTYFSEVINGKREFVTDKLELLCIKLEIEINDYI